MRDRTARRITAKRQGLKEILRDQRKQRRVTSPEPRVPPKSKEPQVDKETTRRDK